MELQEQLEKWDHSDMRVCCVKFHEGLLFNIPFVTVGSLTERLLVAQNNGLSMSFHRQNVRFVLKA